MFKLMTRQLSKTGGTQTAQLLKKFFKIQFSRLSEKRFEHLDVDETNQGKNKKLHEQANCESIRNTNEIRNFEIRSFNQGGVDLFNHSVRGVYSIFENSSSR